MSRLHGATVKLTSEEKAAWKAAANDAGLPLYAWIRLIGNVASGVSNIDEQLKVLRSDVSR